MIKINHTKHNIEKDEDGLNTKKQFRAHKQQQKKRVHKSLVTYHTIFFFFFVVVFMYLGTEIIL